MSKAIKLKRMNATSAVFAGLNGVSIITRMADGYNFPLDMTDDEAALLYKALCTALIEKGIIITP